MRGVRRFPRVSGLELTFAAACSAIVASSAVTGCRVGDDGEGTRFEVRPVGTSRHADSWEAVQTLAPAGRSPLFGKAIAAGGDGSRDVLVVGDAFAKAAYVFERGPHAWEEKAKIVRHGGEAIDFGSSVAASANAVFVRTLPSETVAGPHRVQVFAAQAGGWAFVQDLVGDPIYGEVFGASIAVDGDTVVVGATSDATDPQGAVYVFERSATGFTRTQKLGATPSPPRKTATYGASVALRGDRLVVGSISEEAGPTTVVALYVYRRESGAFVLDERIPVSAGYGWSTCVAGDVVALGSVSIADVALAFERTTSWTALPTLASGGTGATVRCDGARVAVAPLTDLANGRPIQIHAPKSGGVDTVTFTGVTGDYAMYDETLFVGTGSGVEVRRLGALVGAACKADTECAGSFCVDGVCCESVCGGGAENDCQACSAAKGASADGRCTVLGAAHVCRVARDVCDEADRCDGQNAACPVDVVAPNGTSCAGGVCTAGVCAPPGEAAAPGADPLGAAPPEDSGGCAVGAVGSRAVRGGPRAERPRSRTAPGAVLAALAAVALATARRASRARRRDSEAGRRSSSPGSRSAT